MFRFGLTSLKTINYVFAALVMAAGMILLIAAITFRTKWQDGGHILGTLFTSSPDLAFGLGIVIIIIGFLGLLGVCLCKPKLLWLYVVLLVLLIPVLIVAGFYLYCDGYSDFSTNVIRVNSVMRSLSPVKLDTVQRIFHCCGIEKFTDYIILWGLWGMNSSQLGEPSPAYILTTRAPPFTEKETYIVGPSTLAPKKRSNDEGNILTREHFFSVLIFGFFLYWGIVLIR